MFKNVTCTILFLPRHNPRKSPPVFSLKVSENQRLGNLPKVTQWINLLYFTRFQNSTYLSIFWGGKGVGTKVWGSGQIFAYLPHPVFTAEAGAGVGEGHAILALPEGPMSCPCGRIQSQVNAGLDVPTHGPSLGLSVLNCEVAITEPPLFSMARSGLEPIRISQRCSLRLPS